MAKKFAYVFDVGSGDVTLYGFYKDRSATGCFFSRSASHDGLTNFFFKNPERTAAVMTDLVNECAEKAGKEPGEIYLVLPYRFFRQKSVQKNIEIKNGVVNKFDNKIYGWVVENIVFIESEKRHRQSSFLVSVFNTYLDNICFKPFAAV